MSNDVVVDSVHVDWDINFSLGYMCTTPIYYGGFNQRNLDLFSATHSQDGDVMTRIELEDETCINLDSLNTISLRFSKSDTPIPEGYVRDYVMVTVGKYENVEGRPLQQSNLLYNNGLPKEYKLGQNFPNPFNPITKVKYELPFDSKVVLKVFDITGREVTTLVNEQLKAGYYESVFNGNTLSSGVYFMRLVAGNYVQTKKMVLMK